MKLKLLVCVGAFSFIGTSYIAAQTLPSAHIKVRLIEATSQFKSLEEQIQDTVIEQQALSPQGAQVLTKTTRGFNSVLQKLELVEAYTHKKSGVKIPVNKDAISIQRGYVAPGTGVTMPEWEVHQWTFPSVDAGDSTVARYKITTLKAPLPGWQSTADFLWPVLDADKVVWRIEAPQDMALQVRSSLSPTVSTTTAGLSVWQFESSMKGKSIDPNPSSTRTAVPYLMASTIADSRTIADLFAKAVLEKSKLTPEVKELAAKITTGLTTDEQKAKALYGWVQKEIKYVAFYLANGGWEPHDITHILQKRYGDCKDHVTLLNALLTAVGIESEPVLINTLNEYVADPLPVQSYNHTILYITPLKRYVDPTASNIPFETIPWVASGKPVVRSNGAVAWADRVPVLSAQANTVSVKTKMAVASDGSAQGSLELETSGNPATLMQDRLEQIPAGFAESAMQQILQSSNHRGSGFLKFDKVNRDVQKQKASAEFEIKDLLREPTAGSAVTHPSLNLPIYILNNMGNHSQDKREFAYACNSFTAKEEFEIAYDSKYQLTRPPVDIQISIEGVTFSASYKFANNVLWGTRTMVISHPSQECTPQEYLRRKATMVQIARHLRAPMLYSQN